MPRPTPTIDLPLRLEQSEVPLRHRIADAVVALIRDGRLRPGEALPSSRALAADLGVSRGSVVAAYDELAAAGFVIARAGAGVRVAIDADLAAQAGAATHVPPLATRGPAPTRAPQPLVRWDLRAGRPDTTLIDPTAWRRAWRRGASDSLGPAAGEWNPRHTRLREQLSDQLRRTRGIRCDPDEIVIAPGVAVLTHVLAGVLDLRGRAVGIEDPGYVEAWSALQSAGVPTRALPVDQDGLDPSSLSSDLGAVYVTPAHQYPLGARLPVGRRAELLAWADEADAVVIEDDYDGEFRYGVAPLPALRSMDGAATRVLYLGTASKILSPGLRVAWVVAPEPLRTRLRVELERRALIVSETTGAALAEFIASGAWTAHHARAARTYAARRAALVSSLEHFLPGVELAGIDAGLHLVLRLPAEVDDLAVTDALARQGIGVAPLSAYCFEADERGLVLCYASLPETAAAGVARLLSHTLKTETSPTRVP